MLPILRPPRSPHETRVHQCMALWQQRTPILPEIPDLPTRILRARLILEEAFEYVRDSGLAAYIDGDMDTPVRFDELVITENGQPDLVGMVDGLADLSVVTVGSFIACGVRAEPILEVVDHNNLLKAAGGHVDEHGKFIKPEGHKPPPILTMLKLQGYGAADDVAVDEHPAVCSGCGTAAERSADAHPVCTGCQATLKPASQ